VTHSPIFRVFVRALQQARRENLAAAGAPMPIGEPKPGWSRRRFLRAAAALAGGGAGLALSAMPARLSAAGAPRIAVVGAGLAGLNAALHLNRRGFAATVYEARTRLGGRVVSTRRALAPGLILDLGGSFINSDHEDMLEIARRFGEPLFDRIEDAENQLFPASAYFFDGRLRPEAEVADALRPLATQIGLDAARLDANFDRFAPFFDRQSVSQYLDRHASKIAAPFVRALVEASIRSEFGVEPEESSALQLLFVLPTVDGQTVDVLSYSDEAYFVRAGSGALIAGFGRRLHDQIRLGLRLTRLQSAGGGYRLTFQGVEGAFPYDLEAEEDIDPVSAPRVGGVSGRTMVHADYVVLALPFTTLRNVELAIPLPAGLRQFIRESHLGRNEKVFAGFSQKVWRREDGFVDDLWGDLGFSVVWEETQRQSGRDDGALTFYIGGGEADAAVGKSAGRVGEPFVRRLEQGIPGVTAAASGEFFRSRWTQDPFVKGSYSSFRPGQFTRFAPFLWIEGDTLDDSQEVAAGNLLFAGEHLSDAFYGFMNGAAQTGRLAAQTIIRRVAQTQAVR
jgi:monoamine oxidase